MSGPATEKARLPNYVLLRLTAAARGNAGNVIICVAVVYFAHFA